MKLYHWTKKENIKSILKEGLKPNGFGIIYLSKFPRLWGTLHQEGVILEVETENKKLTVFEENINGTEILCWGNISPKNITLG